MLFNSFQFALFLPVVLLLAAVMRGRPRIHMLVVASYVFYGAWDPYFLALIFLSTVLDFHCGLALEKLRSTRSRKLVVAASVFGNLSILGFFKYWDFFVGNLRVLLQAVGFESYPPLLELVIPVGVSFYTFQTMGYTIDVYRGKVRACRSFMDFALFVSFFPQLVAGPIERAGNLLPQLRAPKRLTAERLHEGGWLIFWGLYKKIFVADNLAKLVDPVFANPSDYSAQFIILASFAFAFQVYCDFSGYTDIARGVAKWLGIDLMLNFNLPYLSTDPREMWRRWHISLGNWFRDYVYIPLGGNRGTTGRVLFNLGATLVLSGLWHGAEWNFALLGLYHAGLVVVYVVFLPGVGPHLLGWRKAAAVAAMFVLWTIGLVIFRVEQMAHLPVIAAQVATEWGSFVIGLERGGTLRFFSAGSYAMLILGYCSVLLAVQALQGRTGDLLAPMRLALPLRVALYLVLYFSMTLGGVLDGRQFIYFAF